MSAARKLARARQRADDQIAESRLRRAGRLADARRVRAGMASEHGQLVSLSQVERFLDLPHDVQDEFAAGLEADELSDAALAALDAAL